MAILQIGVTCLLPLVFVIIGAVVWFVRRRRR
jgi:cytochrome c-type biogenesis protein CcmH/NrfF